MKGYDEGANTWSAWFQRNWLLLLLIAVGIAGLATALALFLVPCPQVLQEVETVRNVTISVPVNFTEVLVNPLVAVVAMDGSGSVRDFFDIEKGAANTFIQTLDSTLKTYASLGNASATSNAEVTAGISQWSNKVPQVEIPLTRNLNSLNAILDQVALLGGGTSMATGLLTCGREMYGNSPLIRSTAEKLCLVVSDGVSYDTAVTFEDNKSTNAYRNECENGGGNNCQATTIGAAGDELYAFCQSLSPKITPCTLDNIKDRFLADGIYISGLYVGDSTTGQRILFERTSCDPLQNFSLQEALKCPFFTSASSADLDDEARKFAAGLVNEVTVQGLQNVTFQNLTTQVIDVNTVLVCTTEPIYFFFLAMFIPLGLYLFWRPISLFFAKYCCPPKPVAAAPGKLDESPLYTAPVPVPMRHASSRIPSMAPIAAAEPARAPVISDFHQPLAPPAPEPNTLVKSKRYRWSIKAADAYLWNLGSSGVAPLNVNFNGVAPPSAPKQEAKEDNMKRKTQRISLRWSYVPPPNEDGRDSVRSGRSSNRMSSRIVSAVIPQWEPPQPMEPFQEDEIQPGDIDYEYTMCLMRFCPCLRPNTAPQDKYVPEQPFNRDQVAPYRGSDSDSENSLTGIQNGDSGPEGQFSNPQFGTTSTASSFQGNNFDSTYYSTGVRDDEDSEWNSESQNDDREEPWEGDIPDDISDIV